MLVDNQRWAVYEAVISGLEDQCDRCKVFPNHRVTGRESGVPRQVDIWITSNVGGLNHEISIAVECRCYESGRKIGIQDIDAFYGFLQDIGADKGVLVTTTSFTKGAKARADGGKIELKVLTLEEALSFAWGDYILETDCASLSGCWGKVGWSYHERATETIFGFCDSCGTLHIRCGYCGEYDAYPETDDFIRCWNADCQGVFRLLYDHGAPAGISASEWDEDH